jgi:hypoxanthine phosphoribosyltransferase
MACQTSLHPDVSEVVFTAEELQRRVAKMGAELAAQYVDKEPLLLVTLAGAFIFAADLVRYMKPAPPGLQIDFIRASSYGKRTTSSGDVQIQVRPCASCPAVIRIKCP